MRKGVWVQLLGDQGARARIILVLCEYTRIWNAPVVSLVLITFNDTGSLGSPLRQLVYPPSSMVPPLGYYLPFNFSCLSSSTIAPREDPLHRLRPTTNPVLPPAISFLQLNCRGVYSNYEEFLLLLHDLSPGCVCLQ